MTSSSAQTAKQRIFARLSKSLGERQSKLDVSALESAPRPDLGGDAISAFYARMEPNHITYDRVSTEEELTTALLEYLDKHKLPKVVVTGDDARIDAIAVFGDQIEREIRPAVNGDMVGVSFARSAIAESGSIVVTSGKENPGSVNYLTDTHVVLLKESDIVDYKEDAVAAIGDNVPRATNLISGPSCTADVGLTLEYGSHGPRRVHVIAMKS